jgi:hypothetical protein
MPATVTIVLTAKHTDAPATDPDPDAHAVQLDEPAAAMYVPALQAVQLVAPTAAVYVPALHVVQSVDPAAALYVPALHAVQGLLPELLYVPGGQGKEYVMLLTA